MQKSLPWKYEVIQALKYIPCFYVTWSFITTFTKIHHETLSFNSWIQLLSSHPICIISKWKLSYYYGTCLEVLWPIIYVHFQFSHMCNFHAALIPPISRSHISVICHPCYLSSYLCDHMKYFPFSIWATWAPLHPISFYHLTQYCPTVTSISNIWQRQLFWYDHIWIQTCILEEKFPESLHEECDSVLSNSLSRSISRRAPI
jgi:hypothetical protein